MRIRFDLALLFTMVMFWTMLIGFAQNPKANHLRGRSAPYLQRASHGRVHWYPPGPEALDKARSLDRPLLIDVGAIWCNWCDLMDRDSYNQQITADLINAQFVAVKVDYDSQPALVAKLERGQALANLPAGLPLTMFLTPDGKLYFGGGYFPAKAGGGKPSFNEALHTATHLYREERQTIEHEGFDLNLGQLK